MSRDDGSDPATKAAAHYARVRADDAGAADRYALDHWRMAGDANDRAWDRVGRTGDALDAVADDPAIVALRAQALVGPSGRASRPWLRYATAAALVGAVGLGTITLLDRSAVAPVAEATPYATAVGELRTIRLADGTAVTLDAASAVLVQPPGKDRRVELVRGRAMFAVAKDPAHPFVVTSGTSDITALGTHFSVQRGSAAMTVALTEGSVRVRTPAGSRLLKPGQVLAIRGVTTTLVDAAADTESEWQQGRLTFSDTPLEDVAAELERYEGRHITIREAALAAHPFSGSLRTRGGTDALVAALEAYGVAHVVRRDANGIELAAR